MILFVPARQDLFYASNHSACWKADVLNCVTALAMVQQIHHAYTSLKLK